MRARSATLEACNRPQKTLSQIKVSSPGRIASARRGGSRHLVEADRVIESGLDRRELSIGLAPIHPHPFVGTAKPQTRDSGPVVHHPKAKPGTLEQHRPKRALAAGDSVERLISGKTLIENSHLTPIYCLNDGDWEDQLALIEREC